MEVEPGLNFRVWEVSELRVTVSPDGGLGALYGRAGTLTVKKSVFRVAEDPAIPVAHQ